jgi:hypothetical protein
MSKILVIEPYKILRHAFCVALSNDHQVDIVTTIPEAATLSDAGLVIVDGAALRERNLLAAQNVRAVQNWKFPVIWIDADAETSVPGGDRLLRLRWPIDKDALKKAVAECLGRVNGSNQLAAKTKSRAGSASSKRKQAELKSSPAAAHGEREFIELVDVVE